MKENRVTRAVNIPQASIVALATLLAVCAAVLSSSGIVTAAPEEAKRPSCATGVDFLGFSDALDKRTFEGTTVGGLSALAYDARRGLYYSLVDNGPTPTSEARFYTLRVPIRDGKLGEPALQDVTTLKDESGVAFTASNFDGEGLALTRRGKPVASSEAEPSIRRFSRSGELQKELPVPQKFLVAPAGEGRRNQTFESLSYSPNRGSLFTATEGSLLDDGETTDGGERIRILR